MCFTEKASPVNSPQLSLASKKSASMEREKKIFLFQNVEDEARFYEEQKMMM